MLGGLAAAVWGVSTVLGFQQFGLPTVLFGLALAYSGSAAFAWRLRSDRIKRGDPPLGRSLHLKLTGAMLAVMTLDGAGYLIAVANIPRGHEALVTVEDGCLMGGAGSAVTEALNAAGLSIPVLQLGLPDEFVEHGDPAKLMSLCGLDAAGIEASIVKRFGAKPVVVHSAAR